MKKIYILNLYICAFLILFANGALGANWCVDPGGGSDFTDLQAALNAGETNLEDDTIKVVQGTYNGNFSYTSSQGNGITLHGGYSSGCSNRIIDPPNTILDGGDSDRVLFLHNTSGGGINISGFTIQNGNTGGGGGGIYAVSENTAQTGTTGNVIINNTIIKENTAGTNGGGVFAGSSPAYSIGGNVVISNSKITGNTATLYDGGGVYVYSITSSGTLGNITLVNNIITGNTCDDRGGGVYISASLGSGSGGTVTLTNNTITENTGDITGGVYLTMDGNTNNVYNNIIRGNTGISSEDIYIFNSGTANGYNNNYSELAGETWIGYGGNIDADPLFRGDYHLKRQSPCIDTGTNSAPSLQSNDIDGDDRTVDGDRDSIDTVDMGADEFIFKAVVTNIILLILN